MTILNVTVTERFAVVSQDTFAADPSHVAEPGAQYAISEDMTAALSSCLVGEGAPGDIAPLGFVNKMVVLPQLSMIVAGSGNYCLLSTWSAVLARCTLAGDIGQLNVYAPMFLRRLSARLKLETASDIIVHAGYLRREERAVAYAYSSANDFESVGIEPERGHFVSPSPAPDDQNYAVLAEHWTRAAHGDATELFHVQLAENQYATHRRGLYRKGSGVGGQLHLARVERDRIGVRVAHEFTGFAEQRETVRQHDFSALVASLSDQGPQQGPQS